MFVANQFKPQFDLVCIPVCVVATNVINEKLMNVLRKTKIEYFLSFRNQLF